MKTEEKILLIGASFWWFGEGLFGPLFAVFAGKVGGNILDISWAWAIYLLVTGVLEIFIGRLSDKFGHERLMILGFALNAALTFCYLFVNNAAELFLLQAGLGVALAFADPTWDALYAKYSDAKKVGFLWGLEQGTEAIITGLSIIVGGFIVSYLSFNALFVIMGIIQVVATVYQAKILYVHNKKRPLEASIQ
jgi:MFS family permease